MKMGEKWLSMEEVEELYGLDMEEDKIIDVLLDEGYVPVTFENNQWKVLVIPKMIVKMLAMKYSGDKDAMKKDIAAFMQQMQGKDTPSVLKK